MLFERIRSQIQEAEEHKEKVAMLHYQILINADKLCDINPDDFCKAVEIAPIYQVEFRKMLKLAKMIDKQSMKIVKI